MKRPLLDEEQRSDIRHDTYYGAKLRMHLSVLHLKRKIHMIFEHLFKL